MDIEHDDLWTENTELVVIENGALRPKIFSAW